MDLVFLFDGQMKRLETWNLVQIRCRKNCQLDYPIRYMLTDLKEPILKSILVFRT